MKQPKWCVFASSKQFLLSSDYRNENRMSVTDCWKISLTWVFIKLSNLKFEFQWAFFCFLGEITSEEYNNELDGVKEQIASQPDLRMGQTQRYYGLLSIRNRFWLE